MDDEPFTLPQTAAAQKQTPWRRGRGGGVNVLHELLVGVVQDIGAGLFVALARQLALHWTGGGEGIGGGREWAASEREGSTPRKTPHTPARDEGPEGACGTDEVGVEGVEGRVGGVDGRNGGKEGDELPRVHVRLVELREGLPPPPPPPAARRPVSAEGRRGGGGEDRIGRRGVPP
jgi:hypothetical protein